MREIILIKNGELALKGLNRKNFEDALVKNMRHRISDLGEFKFIKAQSTIMVEPLSENADLHEAFERLKKVFGIAGLSRAVACEKNMDEVLHFTCEYLKDSFNMSRTFKVNAKRSDKSFPLKSPEICAITGEKILTDFPHLTVDVHNPDIIVTVEIRDREAFIHGNQVKGAGGMPVGTGGKAALLISGGIDSPVAGYMIAKRGIILTAVHFASPPYTSELAEEKVHRLLKKVSEYSGRLNLYTVPFTELQEAIRAHCPEDLFTLVMRRLMMKISSVIAKREGCGALVTGESLGQVASQTLSALQCTDDAALLPVLRPLIGMDKDEIVAVSRRIDTFDISIEPFEDCCTVFTPRHPRLKPELEKVIMAEQKVLAAFPEDIIEATAKAATHTVIG